MAFNFWEAQRRAKSRTKIYVAIFVLLTLGVALTIEFAFRSLAGPQFQSDAPLLGLVFLGITFGVAFFQYSMFQSYGGGYVAQSVGGRHISPDTINPKEQQLLNIVEEMAIASAVPAPPIFILESKQINAFAAGLTRQNAAIAITRGALEKLDREEIQGVIAHEFGHIYNGDMKISTRLAAMVMGFFFVFYLAFRMLQFSYLTGGRRQNSSKGGNPIALAALLLFAAGVFTWIFGSILKASVSREREYLADACAVQFTRNPQGIADALLKIGKDSVQDMPKEGLAYSHLYFSNRSFLGGLFATHPPLEKRIAAIVGRTYLPDEWKEGLD